MRKAKAKVLNQRSGSHQVITPVVVNDQKERKQRIKLKTKNQRAPGQKNTRGLDHDLLVQAALLLNATEVGRRKSILLLGQGNESVLFQAVLRESKKRSTEEREATTGMKKRGPQDPERGKDQDLGLWKDEKGDQGQPLHQDLENIKALNLKRNSCNLDRGPKKGNTSQKRC